MKFFIDTAGLAGNRDLAATGLVDGVTANPSLVAKSGRNFLAAARGADSVAMHGNDPALTTQVPAASIRNPGRVGAAAPLGAAAE